MLEQLINGSSIYLQLVRFFLVAASGIFLTRAVLMPLTSRILSGRNSTKKAKHSVENMTGLLGLFTTLVIALQAASFGNLLTIIGTLAAAATVAIGFGMRDQVASVVAGVFIHADNPFVKGDYIKFNDTEGKIKEIRLRSTVLNSQNDRKIVPNNLLTTNTVRNFTEGTRTSDTVTTKVDQSKAEKAEELLLETADKNDSILEKPAPETRYTAIDDGKVELEISYWMKETADIRGIRSQVLEEYIRKARAEGVHEEVEKQS